MGLGCNRFMNHVFAYKGPTLTLLKADNGSVFCIASVNEWKESHLYWGGEDSAVFQMLPKYDTFFLSLLKILIVTIICRFSLLDKGSKILYINMSARGYPMGLRAGKDPRSPIIVVDGSFEKVSANKLN